MLEIIVGIVFSREIDFFTKTLIVLALCSFGFMIVYLVLPMSGRRIIDNLDMDEKAGGSMSLSGGISLIMFIAIGITVGNRYGLLKSKEEKLTESMHEKHFRQQQQFSGDVQRVMFQILLGIWLTFNFIMKVNRMKRTQQEII